MIHIKIPVKCIIIIIISHYVELFKDSQVISQAVNGVDHVLSGWSHTAEKQLNIQISILI